MSKININTTFSAHNTNHYQNLLSQCQSSFEVQVLQEIQKRGIPLRMNLKKLYLYRTK